MSDLPAGWERSRLGDLGHEVRGSVTPIRGTTYELYSVPTYPTGRPERLRGEEIGSTKRPVEPGDVLLCKINPRINRVWTVAERSGASPQIASTEYFVFRTPEPRLTAYLRWYFLGPTFRRWIQISAEGATGSHTRAKSGPILEQLIPIPPVEEQERIVAALEEHVSRLNAADAALTEARQRLPSLRSGLIGSLLGLSTIAGLDDDADAVPLTAGWTWVRASDACEMVSSGSTPSVGDMFAGTGEVPFIKVYNLQFDGSLNFTIKPTFVPRATHEGQLRRSRLLPGDVLMNIVGPPLGKVSLVPEDHPEWNMNQAVAAFRPRPFLRSDLLAYLLMTPSVVEPLLRTGKATAGQINLNISACRRLWLPVPPLPLQASLVMHLDAASSAWRATVGQVAVASARGDALRRSILAAAFSGKLVPQDPDDEPASILLERIRDLRAGAMPRRRTRTRPARGEAPRGSRPAWEDGASDEPGRCP